MNQRAFTPPAWSISDREFDQLSRTIHRYSGIVIGPEKRGMIRARLQKRLVALQLDTLAEYLDIVSGVSGRAERERFVSSLTTNVTSFFREKHHFAFLVEAILPALGDTTRPIRIWSAGCSSGQEPYSIAMSVLDAHPEMAQRLSILGSDIDADVLAKARRGIYAGSSLTGISDDFRSRFFEPVEDGRGTDLRIRAQLRDLVTYQQINLNAGWPISEKFDVIFCRNTAIYFAPQTQCLLWRKFHDVLRPGGWLLIGHSERVPAECHHLLQPAGITAYQKPG
ncbi:chemotaxis protein methyltransferase CheR [Paracoccus isoporae]|uniref:Chemotaxis protein methyltransferase n=1 Tax=Paracoccus isoporae TaxID=591205 RepID=A0A1G6WEF9_9RHOB|nr:protein-glutamate O-methyltransferase CheR [Paracoccus isoporae]SDD63455.1 chemotaxis protein methyltransferase CheR [Paracoccus isoporae]